MTDANTTRPVTHLVVPQSEVSNVLTPRQVRPFNYVHLIVFLACWIPLNPILVETFRNPNFSVEFSLRGLATIAGTICGPFAPWLVDRSAKLQGSLILIAGTLLLTGILVQFFWIPTQIRYEFIRQLVWAIGWWVWFCSAFVALVSLM